MRILDTHCHLDVSCFDPDRSQILDRARSAGVAGIVVPGIHAAGWAGLLELCRVEADLFPALGMHPIYLAHHSKSHLEELERLIERERPVAVGEIGLDFFVTDLDRKAQQDLFEDQLALARNAGLPVLLHVRKAHDQVLACLARAGVSGGIAHAFNGSLQQAARYGELGFKLGFGGMLTYARSTRLRRLAAELPLGVLVLETDAPDMAVASHHRERNSPEYLPECLQALAEVRREEPEMVAAATTRNALEVLHLPLPESAG